MAKIIYFFSTLITGMLKLVGWGGVECAVHHEGDVC